MEQQRTHVLEWTDRIRKIPFSPAPASYVDPRTVVIKKAELSMKATKLDRESVRAIRASLAARETLTTIAARHQVSITSITSIRDGRTWTDVE